MDRSAFTVHLLGGFAVQIAGQTVPGSAWSQRRAASIIKVLALTPGHWLHREILLEMLWPDLDIERAANNLRVALHYARRVLERAGAPAGMFLVRDGDGLLLGSHQAMTVDVEQFDTAVSRAWQSTDPAVGEGAVALYRGDLLPEDPYEDWAVARRETLRASLLSLLTRIAGLHEQREDLHLAVAARQRSLAIEPFDEATHAALMQLHMRMGNRDLALAQYAQLESLLERELDTTPEAETRELAAAIRASRSMVAPAPRMLAPKERPALAPVMRLPAAVDTLVGRERELAEIQRLLTSERVVTLTGPGGVGKTRLALEVARAAQDRFPFGAGFVDLAPLSDPALLLPAIAHALGIAEARGRALNDVVTAAIGEHRTLIVLDNVEQVAAAAPDIGRLLLACPNLTILATSRVRLRLRGEQEYPVAPLLLPEVPEGGRTASIEDVSSSPAMMLFAWRASQARPAFVLSDTNVSFVTAVCRRLDGLPLALELAAARVRVLTPEQLLRRLERPLDVLESQAVDLPARQRTLRGTIAWSHDLLDSVTRTAFRQLSVFAGGFSLDAAETILDDDPASDVLETITRLVDQSLVQSEDDAHGERRFTMLATIREFGIEQLAASSDGHDVRHRHARWAEALLIEANTHARGWSDYDWFPVLEREHDNIRAALAWASEDDAADLGLRLAAAASRFWSLRGHYAEGRSWLERIVAKTTDAPPRLRAEALEGLGNIAAVQGDFDAAAAVLEESIALRKDDPPATHANALALLSSLIGLQGDSGRAETLARAACAAYEASVALARERGDLRGLGSALKNLASVVWSLNGADRAGPLLEEAAALQRQTGDLAGLASSLNNLGELALQKGDRDRGAALFEESLAIDRALGNPAGAATTLNMIADLVVPPDDLRRIAGLQMESLQLSYRVGDQLFVAYCLAGIAEAAARAGEPEIATRLFAATERQRETIGSPLQPDELPRWKDGVARARAPLSEAVFTRAWVAGQTMPITEAITQALAIAKTLAEPGRDTLAWNRSSG